MRHIYRTRKQIIEYYDKKILIEIQKTKDQCKKDFDKELQKHKSESSDKINEIIAKHRTEKHEIEVEHSKQLNRLNLEHEKAIISETNRINNKIQEYDRKIKKHDDLVLAIENKKNILDELFERSDSINSGMIEDYNNLKFSYANFLRKFGHMENLKLAYKNGNTDIPQATVMSSKKLEMKHE